MSVVLMSSPLEPLFDRCNNFDDSYFPSFSPPKVSQQVFSWSDFPCQCDNYSQSHDEGTSSTCASPALAIDISSATFILSNLPSLDSLIVEKVPIDKLRKTCSDFSKESHVVSKSSTFKKPRRNFKSVSFACSVEVRTHSLIIGNHPCCKGGMALECGWDYNESQFIILDSYEVEKRQKLGLLGMDSIQRNPNDFRLTYAERRERLLQVTGWTGRELVEEEHRVVNFDQTKASNTSINIQRRKSHVQTLHHTQTLVGLNMHTFTLYQDV